MLTFLPSSPVCLVTRVEPSIRAALSRASSADFTRTTPRLLRVFLEGPLAASAGVDLRLDDRHRRPEGRDGGRRLFGGAGDDSPGIGTPALAKKFLALVFVNLHGGSATKEHVGRREHTVRAR